MRVGDLQRPGQSRDRANRAGRLNSIVTGVRVCGTCTVLTSTAFSGLTYYPGGAVETANLAIDPTSNVAGIALSRTYDNRGRITAEADTNSSKQSAYSYSVSYDGSGSVKAYNDSVVGNWTVTNDNLHRLSKMTGSLDGVSATLQDTYDPFGNRYVEYLTSNGTQLQPSPYLNFYSGNNRVSSWSYDNAGNQLSDGSNNYLYDAENRICAVQQLSPLTGTFGYVYAANGPLLGLGNLTSFTCDLTKNGMLTANGLALTNAYMAGPQGERLIEVNGSNFNLLHYNAFWEGKLLGTFSGTTEVQTNWHFALNDWLGTKRVTTTSTGAPWTSTFSGPFGDFQSQTGPGSDPSEEHFTSKPRDTNSNLDYFGARYYNSNIGRFMSPDWNAKAEPVPYARLEFPQSLNLYSYLLNNPMSGVDPSGHGPQAPGGAAMQCASVGYTCGYALNTNNAQTATQDEFARESAAAAAQWQNGSSGGNSFRSHVSNLLHGHSWNYGMRESVTVNMFYQVTGTYNFTSGSMSYVPSTGNLIVGAGPGVGDGAAAVVGFSEDPEGYLKGWSGTGCGFAGGGGCFGQSPGSAPAYMFGLGFGGWGASYTWGTTVEPGEFNAYEPGTVKMGDAYFDDEAGTWLQQ